MIRVYIAGPYSIGDVGINVKKAMDVCNELINMGYAPFCPHLYHYAHIHNPQEYHTWLDIDIEFLKVCDVVLRIPGQSPGADHEVDIATDLNIPVYYSINELHRNENIRTSRNNS